MSVTNPKCDNCHHEMDYVYDGVEGYFICLRCRN